MKAEIKQAIEKFNKGEIIGFPTSTGWGLACSPKADKSIEKLNSLSEESSDNSPELLVDSEQLLQRYVREIPEICFDLIDCAIRPLTIVYPEGQYVSKKLLGADQSIAIRIISDEFSKELIQQFKQGIAFIHYPQDRVITAADYVVNLQKELKFKQSPQIIKIRANLEFQIIRP